MALERVWCCWAGKTAVGYMLQSASGQTFLTDGRADPNHNNSSPAIPHLLVRGVPGGQRRIDGRL